MKRPPRPAVELIDPDSTEALVLMTRLSQDLKKAARELTVGQARFLVDAYYQIQQFRIEAAGQKRASEASGEPVAMVSWIELLMRRTEGAIRAALDEFSDTHIAGRWVKSIRGIGPVISAGLLAHIDVRRAPTAGAVWRFAGLDPTSTWAKGTKRPWNAQLKVLCWKIGESFVKVSGHDEDVYGHVWAARKQLELERDATGQFSEQAARMLREKTYRRVTVAKSAYESGHLPAGHLHARAKRYAVKLFLAHYHHVAYEVEFGTPPPKPYVLEHGGHVHFISPPNWPMTETS